jgi:hypothetical protein
MGKHGCVFGYRLRNRYPHRTLAAAVLDRARRDCLRGRSITTEERDALRWWASRGGLTSAVVDPLLSDRAKATAGR